MAPLMAATADRFKQCLACKVLPSAHTYLKVGVRTCSTETSRLLNRTHGITQDDIAYACNMHNV